MSHRMTELKLSIVIRKAEVDKLIKDAIDEAIRKHNRNASLISIALGTIALIGYADGIMRILERIQ